MPSSAGPITVLGTLQLKGVEVSCHFSLEAKDEEKWRAPQNYHSSRSSSLPVLAYRYRSGWRGARSESVSRLQRRKNYGLTPSEDWHATGLACDRGDDTLAKALLCLKILRYLFNVALYSMTLVRCWLLVVGCWLLVVSRRWEAFCDYSLLLAWATYIIIYPFSHYIQFSKHE
jgi:hypothetical protein